MAKADNGMNNAAGVANSYLQRDPAFFGHLAAAQSPEAAQAVMESIRMKAKRSVRMLRLFFRMVLLL